MSPGTLLEEEVADRPDEPGDALLEASRADTGSAPGDSACAGRHQVRKTLDRVEPGLEPGHVLTGEGIRRPVDLRGRARAHDVGDRERRADVRGDHRRSRTGSGRARAPAARRSGCPRCRTARRGRGSRDPDGVIGISTTIRLVVLLPPWGRSRRRFAGRGELGVRRHWAAEVGAAVGDDREARQLAEETVVADERRAPRHLALRRIRREGGDHVLAHRVVAERADVLLLDTLVQQRGPERESRIQGGSRRPPITPPSPSVDSSRKIERETFSSGTHVDAAEARPRLRRRRARQTLLGLHHVGRLGERGAAGQLADPGDREDRGDDRAHDGTTERGDDEPNEQHDDTERQGRQATGSGRVRAGVRGSVPSR